MSLSARLTRLEDRHGAGVVDVAAVIEAAQRRTARMTPDELAAERREELAEAERQHARRPLEGLALSILYARRRVAAPDVAEASR